MTVCWAGEGFTTLTRTWETVAECWIRPMTSGNLPTDRRPPVLHDGVNGLLRLDDVRPRPLLANYHLATPRASLQGRRVGAPSTRFGAHLNGVPSTPPPALNNLVSRRTYTVFKASTRDLKAWLCVSAPERLP